jgi:hypothetical protein
VSRWQWPATLIVAGVLLAGGCGDGPADRFATPTLPPDGFEALRELDVGDCITDGASRPLQPAACDSAAAAWRINGIAREQRPLGEQCPDPDGQVLDVSFGGPHLLCLEPVER